MTVAILCSKLDELVGGIDDALALRLELFSSVVVL
jgi:hypothetical protein